ncbi:hypothetical protein DIE08_33970 [Burkholderia sp. Bp9004]|nr:hypothetical protein DIE08_33970 [Burkholderia sp. Bp9004]
MSVSVDRSACTRRGRPCMSQVRCLVCAMRREPRGSGGRLSGCRRRIQSADARTIGARTQIGYGTSGERAIRETQIIGASVREASAGGAERAAARTKRRECVRHRGNPSWTSADRCRVPPGDNRIRFHLNQRRWNIFPRIGEAPTHFGSFFPAPPRIISPVTKRKSQRRT